MRRFYWKTALVTPLLSDLPNVISPSDPFFTPYLNDFDTFFLDRPVKGNGNTLKLNLYLFVRAVGVDIDNVESFSSNLHVFHHIQTPTI